MSVYVKRTKKNGVHVLTSSYFDDVKMLRESLKDSNVSAMRRDKNSTFDVSRLILSSVAKQIELWRCGCIELSRHVENMTPNQRKVYETEYMGIDYDPNNTEMAEIINNDNDD